MSALVSTSHAKSAAVHAAAGKSGRAPLVDATELSPTQLAFRTGMAHLAAAVSVVTTNGPAGELGITVSAVCSVTDSPPTVLVCVNKRSAAHDVFMRNGAVAINVLSADQVDIAKHFSGSTQVPMDERFAWDIWDKTSVAPVLREARVALIGHVVDRVERGTHSAMFIEIASVVTRDEADGLVYFGRDFHGVGTATNVA